jgi:hypothetical protein
VAYVDEWGSTSDSDRKKYERRCLIPTCRHVYYRHGRTKHGYNNVLIGHEEGPCELCKCPKFAEVPPITEDEVVDLHEMLKPEGLTLSALGIEPFGSPCPVTIGKWVGVTRVAGHCTKDRGHAGEHEPLWDEV